MRPEIFKLPFNVPLLGDGIKGYGFMMMVGFLSAIYLITRRVMKAKGDPDLILNCGFVALIAGVAGARAFYVIHYWDSQFAFRPDKVWAILNVSAGGLEFYGGFLGAMVCIITYLVWKRVSFRMYGDLIVPGLFWGLAVTRVGCFLNGCCWGGVCMTETGAAALPWAIRFPFMSAPHYRHWQEMRVTVPAELLTVNKYGQLMPLLRDYIDVSPETMYGPRRKAEEAAEVFERVQRRGDDPKKIEKRQKETARAERAARRTEAMYKPLTDLCEKYERSQSQINELAGLLGSKSLPVHPAQLYSAITAMLLSLFLTLLLHVRKRHGVVFGTALVLYPIQRFVLELVRTDNPHDTIGLTISQAVSLGMFAVGVLYVLAVFRLPLRSALAVPFEPPPEDASNKKNK